MLYIAERLFYQDFMENIKNVLSLSGWNIDIDGFDGAFRYLKISSNGTSLNENMHYTIKEYKAPDDDIYGIQIFLYNGYDSLSDYDNQSIQSITYMPLFFGYIRFYINTTKDYFHLAVKTGDLYNFMSFGKMDYDNDAIQLSNNYYALTPSINICRYNDTPTAFIVKAIDIDGVIRTANTYPSKQLFLQANSLNFYYALPILIYTTEQLGYIKELNYISGFSNASENFYYSNDGIKKYGCFSANKNNDISQFFTMEIKNV